MVDAALGQGLGWNLVDDLRQLTAYPFMVHALLAGTIVAVTAGVTGWFVVLRRQVFAGHTLAIIAFPGAAAASLAGLPLTVGYFGTCASGPFLLVLGLSVAETSQITGALLVFALLVTPAATAQLITSRPGLGVAISVLVAVLVTWLGLAAAFFSTYPVGFYVTSLAFGLYLVA